MTARLMLRRAQPQHEGELREPRSLKTWLDVFCGLLRMKANQRDSIREELSAHLHERVRDLMLDGRAEHDALQLAVRELGEAVDLARRFEHAHTLRYRRLIMNLTLLGFGAAALTLGVMTAVNLTSNPAPRAPYSVFGNTTAAEQEAALPDRNNISLEGNLTFEEALGVILNDADLPLTIHWTQLEETDLDREATAEFAARRVSMRRALDLVAAAFDPHFNQIAWRLVDGGIEVGSREHADRASMSLVAYDIEEIIHALMPYHADVNNVLRDLFMSMVSPNDWEDMGGIMAKMQFVGTRLFIEAPARMHERVVWILSQLEDAAEETIGRAPAPAGDAHRGPFPERRDPRLTIGDEVIVEVRDLLGPGWHRAHRIVEHDGTLRLPHWGAVPAAGRTFDEIENELRTAIEELVRNPEVSVYTPAPGRARIAEDDRGVDSRRRRLELIEEIAVVDQRMASLKGRIDRSDFNAIERQRAEEDPTVRSLAERLSMHRVESRRASDQPGDEHRFTKEVYRLMELLEEELTEARHLAVMRAAEVTLDELRLQRADLQARLATVERHTSASGAR